MSFNVKKRVCSNVYTALSITLRLCDRTEELCILFKFEYITWWTHENMVRVIDCMGWFHFLWQCDTNWRFFLMGDVNAETNGFFFKFSWWGRFSKTYDTQILSLITTVTFLLSYVTKILMEWRFSPKNDILGHALIIKMLEIQYLLKYNSFSWLYDKLNSKVWMTPLL